MTTDAANAVEEIHRLLRPGVTLRAAAPGILSALPLDAPSHPYDAKAAIYDLVVARRLYNRILWGANRDDYSAFERLAVDAPRRGWMLGAGCGSLVFTHRIYARYAGPPIVLVDRSLGMLLRARQRLRGQETTANLVFLQADLLELPFRAGQFETISCPGLLHLFADTRPLIESLCQSLAPQGGMYFTSLVDRPERKFAGRYLRWLERNGEVASPRTLPEVNELLSEFETLKCLYCTARGNMAYLANRPFWDAEAAR